MLFGEPKYMEQVWKYNVILLQQYVPASEISQHARLVHHEAELHRRSKITLQKQPLLISIFDLFSV